MEKMLTEPHETGEAWRNLPLSSVSSLLESADADPQNTIWSHTIAEEKKDHRK